MRFLNFCAKTPTLIATFIAIILLSWGFGMFEHHIGGSMLDVQFRATDALARLSQMSAAQKTSHIWQTLTIDSLYPLAAFMFLAGLSWRFGGAKRGWLILPALIYILSDYAENLMEVFILQGHTDLLTIKTGLTWLKTGALTCAFLIAILLLVRTGYTVLKARSQ